MANSSTTKLAPRVTKSPDADFSPEYDPAYDPAANVKARHTVVEPQATSPWGYIWAVLILLMVGFIAYGYYNNGSEPVPSQTTTSVAPASDAPAATPPTASTAAPAVRAAPADGSTTTLQAPATTTTP